MWYPIWIFVGVVLHSEVYSSTMARTEHLNNVCQHHLCWVCVHSRRLSGSLSLSFIFHSFSLAFAVHCFCWLTAPVELCWRHRNELSQFVRHRSFANSPTQSHTQTNTIWPDRGLVPFPLSYDFVRDPYAIKIIMTKQSKTFIKIDALPLGTCSVVRCDKTFESRMLPKRKKHILVR